MDEECIETGHVDHYRYRRKSRRRIERLSCCRRRLGRRGTWPDEVADRRDNIYQLREVNAHFWKGLRWRLVDNR